MLLLLPLVWSPNPWIHRLTYNLPACEHHISTSNSTNLPQTAPPGPGLAISENVPWSAWSLGVRKQEVSSSSQCPAATTLILWTPHIASYLPPVYSLQKACRTCCVKQWNGFQVGKDGIKFKILPQRTQPSRIRPLPGPAAPSPTPLVLCMSVTDSLSTLPQSHCISSSLRFGAFE